ncbi:MAG: glycoside hydrolase family 25 protein [Bacteroidaceae bacterium]|nr:glycoside hydrolase family 25 protein [Bacteroidaceae bacterium]
MATGKNNSGKDDDGPSFLDLVKDALDVPSSQKTVSSNGRQRIASSSPKSVKKKKNKRKKGTKGVVFYLNPRNWKAWAVWTILGSLAAIYVFFFYFWFVGPYSFKWKALYGDVKYPEGYEIHGIDISHYQGEIKWESVRNATINECPIRFIFIKATEGANVMDSYFNENFYQAKANGFIRGAYHFFSPKSSGKEQAQYFLRQVHLEDGDLPPVLDIETVGNLKPLQIKKEVLDWLNVVEARYGVKPIIYTNYRFKLDYLNDEIFDPYPYWIAHYYVEKVRYEGPWRFWQHTDLGRIDGIKEHVDLNIYNGSMYDLMKFTIGSDMEQKLHE